MVSTHIGMDYICKDCLNFTVCRSGQEIKFNSTLNINEQAIDNVKECDVVKNRGKGLCTVEACSFNVTSFETAQYMVRCPLKNSSFHVISATLKVGPVDSLEMCAGIKCIMILTK